MTAPQDLADRLEKAYRLGDSIIAITIAHYYGKRVPSEDYKTLIASLRRSAPASGAMREAFKLAMTGANHIATYRTDRWPDYGSDHEHALRMLHATPEYDMWCCWDACMRARQRAERNGRAGGVD